MRPLSAPLALRQARQHLLELGHCPSGLVDERLARSWQRSVDEGLRPTGRLGAPDNLEQHALWLLRGRHQELLAHSRPVMEYLFEQVRDSQSVVVLAGPCGTLVDTCGDPYFLGKAERVALTSGASWHEKQRGTNAIGTALAEMAPVEVQGAEHFLERNGFLTCSAAPILSGTGQLLGILDISSEHSRGNPHTLGLVSTAAQMIENRLLTSGGQRHMRLHLHAHPEGIGTVAEGILLLSAQWAMEDRDAGRCMALLSELPPGVARRTQALRLKLQAARQLGRPLEALQTARLLAKHQGFSVGAAQSLLRSLAIDALEQALDESQLGRVWQGLDEADRRDPWVLAAAARRAASLGVPGLGQTWLWPAWEQLQRQDGEGREQLALALVACVDAVDTRWLPVMEQALSRYGREPAIVAAAGAVFAHRQLWGKARRLLEQTASAESLPSRVRRQALRVLARIARQEDDEAQAGHFDQRAAALD